MTAILIAPFSNSDIRDWPAGHYEALVGLLAQDDTLDVPIRIIGTPSQRLRASEIVRRFDPRRVINDCGRMAWGEVMAQLRTAACVVGNNSGIAHLSAYFGVPTVCIFGGSHQRFEWRPQGFNVVLLSRSIGCSPCHLDHRSSCIYGKACLREIAPEDVAAAVRRIMAPGSGTEQGARVDHTLATID